MKKVYLKPEVKAFEINTESAFIATSPSSPEMKGELVEFDYD